MVNSQALILFNQANTGRVTGITYFYDGFKVKGQAMGNRFKWAEIIKRINYEQDRDREAISQAKGRTTAKYPEGSAAERANLKQQPDKDEASERELLIQNLYQTQLNNNAASEFIRRTAEQQQLFLEQMAKMEAMIVNQQKDQWKQNRMLIWWIGMVAISEIIILILFVSK